MSKHTQGEWLYRPNDLDDWGVVRCNNWLVANARNPEALSDTWDSYRASKTDPFEANARLISAAPDLLQALKVAQLWLDVDGRYDMQGINAAISKAEGNQP